MMKMCILIIMLFMEIFLCGCAENKHIVMDRARGNEEVNVETAQSISKLNNVKAVSVLCKDDIILAGVKLTENGERTEVGINAMKIIKERFPDAEIYILSIDDQMADDVIELNLYAEAGMERDVLEKRFEYLVEKKLKNGG